MTSSPFQDAVAIDTNVFLHLLNPQENTGSHISGLLKYLQNQVLSLIVDDRGRIAGEYNNLIVPVFRRADEVDNKIDLLRYWILYAPRLQMTVNMSDSLMSQIRQIIIEPSENTDRVFVYVAFGNGSWLISNDEVHIVVGPRREWNQSQRRDRLVRNTRGLCPPGARIMTSREAFNLI